MSTTIFGVSALLYIGTLVFAGWFLTRKNKGGEDFLLGGRSLSLPLLLGTMIASIIGTGSSMGAVGNGYVNGWGGALFGLGNGIGFIILTFTFAKSREQNFVTMAEEVASYYENNRYVKILLSIILTLACVGWTGTHLLGGSFYLSHITQMDINSARIIMAFTFAVYVLIGGYLAVVWTDTIQSFVIFFGFILMTVVSVNVAGGWENITKTVPLSSQSFLGFGKSGVLPGLSLMMTTVVSCLTVPAFRQRVYSAKNYSVIKKSFILTSILYIAFSILPCIIGMAAFTINPDIAQRDLVFPYMATTVLPPVVGMIVLLAGMSATISSGDSEAMAGVTIMVRDLYFLITGKTPPKEKTVLYSRFSIVIIVGLAYVFTMFATNILSYIQIMTSTLLSGIFAISFLGRYWKRSTWQGAIAGIISGSIITFYVNSNKGLADYWGSPVILAVIGACFCTIIVSLLTPPPTRKYSDVVAEIESERSTMNI